MMSKDMRKWFDLPRLLHSYRNRSPLVLVNGLAEQPESWFANRAHLARHFDVKIPEILVYDGRPLHDWIAAGGEAGVDYLTNRLERFLDDYVERPPYHLVGSSLGCQVILAYAARRPANVEKLVLIAPSGLHGGENLPIVEGVRRSDYDKLVRSVFHQGRFASDELVRAFERKFQNRRWKKGVLRVLKATVGHSSTELLAQIDAPALLIWGARDQVLTDLPGSIQAASQMKQGRQVVIPNCGHAPQIEKARLVNQLISRFLRDKLRSIPPALEPARFLSQHAQRRSPENRGATRPLVIQ